MFRALILGCAFVALIATGCGSSAGSARDKALLASVMSGMNTDLASVELAPDPSAPAYRHGLKLVIRSDAARGTAGEVIDDWYGRLIAMGYNAHCEKKADHCVTSFGGSAVYTRNLPHPFAVRRDLSRKVRAAFASAGLQVTSISFERPYGLAPFVTVRTRSSRQAVDEMRDAFAALLRCPSIAGFLIHMLDEHGQVFGVAAADPINRREVWTRRGLPFPGMSDNGPTGVTGPTGPQGPTGANGPAGPQGPTHA